MFSAPLRLDLKIICKCRTPTREILDLWPELPIAIRVSHLYHEIEENAIAALEHEDRVSEVCIHGHSNDRLERIAEAMKYPFPVLTSLFIESTDQTAMLLPNSLFGGRAPRLRSLSLHNVTFSALPRLLLSATGLVKLFLSRLTHSE